MGDAILFDLLAAEFFGLSKTVSPEIQMVTLKGAWELRYDGFGACPSAFSEDPGATMTLHGVQGELALEIVKFGWAGRVEIQNGRERESVDMFSPAHVAHILTLHGADVRDVTLRILSDANPVSQGRQIWIRRVTFAERPIWMRRERRLTRSLDFVYASEGDFITLVNDNAISCEIRLFGVWGQSEVDVFRRFLSPGDVAVDVGANLGHHTVSMARLVESTGKVYAFEPQRRIYRLLCANLAVNRCDHAEAVELALGDRDGTAMMVASSYDNPNHPWNVGGLAAFPVDAEATHDSKVPGGAVVGVRRLDDVLPSEIRVAFIKSDAQGFDYYVISGAKKLLERWQPTILAEISPEGSANAGTNYFAIYELLLGLGYQLRDPATLEVYTTPRVWSGIPGEEWNVLAVHPDNWQQMEKLGDYR